MNSEKQERKPLFKNTFSDELFLEAFVKETNRLLPDCLHQNVMRAVTQDEPLDTILLAAEIVLGEPSDEQKTTFVGNMINFLDDFILLDMEMEMDEHLESHIRKIVSGTTLKNLLTKTKQERQDMINTATYVTEK